MEDCDRREEVYTFNGDIGNCQKVEWKGCETYNKFTDLDSCVQACRGFMMNTEDIEETETKTDPPPEEDDESAAVTLPGVTDEYAGNESPDTEGFDDDIDVENGGNTEEE